MNALWLHTSRLGKLVMSLPLVSVGGHACLHPAPCTKPTTTVAAIAIIVIIITTYTRMANMLHTRWAGGSELLFRLAHVKCCSSVYPGFVRCAQVWASRR
jgi:hypothetical protein